MAMMLRALLGGFSLSRALGECLDTRTTLQSVYSLQNYGPEVWTR